MEAEELETDGGGIPNSQHRFQLRLFSADFIIPRSNVHTDQEELSFLRSARPSQFSANPTLHTLYISAAYIRDAFRVAPSLRGSLNTRTPTHRGWPSLRILKSSETPPPPRSCSFRREDFHVGEKEDRAARKKKAGNVWGAFPPSPEFRPCGAEASSPERRRCCRQRRFDMTTTLSMALLWGGPLIVSASALRGLGFKAPCKAAIPSSAPSGRFTAIAWPVGSEMVPQRDSAFPPRNTNKT